LGHTCLQRPQLFVTPKVETLKIKVVVGFMDSLGDSRQVLG